MTRTDHMVRAGVVTRAGTKVEIDHYATMRDGISLASLGEVGFAYMKYGASTHRR